MKGTTISKYITQMKKFHLPSLALFLFFSFFLIILFIYFIFGCAESSLLHGFTLVLESRGHAPVVVHRFLIAVASFVAEHGF